MPRSQPITMRQDEPIRRLVGLGRALPGHVTGRGGGYGGGCGGLFYGEGAHGCCHVLHV